MDKKEKLQNLALILEILFLIVVTGLILSMITFPESFITIPLIWGFWYLRFQYRWIRILPFLALVLLLPSLLSALTAVGEYVSGEARFRTTGNPVVNDFNYEYRISYESTGCLVSGFEFVTHNPHNATLKLLIKIFGYAKYSYKGRLPSYDEANQLLLNKGVRMKSADMPYLAIPGRKDLIKYEPGNLAGMFMLQAIRTGGAFVHLLDENSMLVGRIRSSPAADEIFVSNIYENHGVIVLYKK